MCVVHHLFRWQSNRKNVLIYAWTRAFSFPCPNQALLNHPQHTAWTVYLVAVNQPPTRHTYWTNQRIRVLIFSCYNAVHSLHTTRKPAERVILGWIRERIVGNMLQELGWSRPGTRSLCPDAVEHWVSIEPGCHSSERDTHTTTHSTSPIDVKKGNCDMRTIAIPLFWAQAPAHDHYATI